MALSISVHIHANATKNEITGVSNGVWQIRVSAPPVKGKANKELITFLSKVLGVKQSSVSITKGRTSRNKVITIEGLTAEEIAKHLLLGS